MWIASFNQTEELFCWLSGVRALPTTSRTVCLKLRRNSGIIYCYVSALRIITARILLTTIDIIFHVTSSRNCLNLVNNDHRD